MNYLKSGRVYKQSMLNVRKQSLDYVNFIRSNIRKEIARRKAEE